MYIAIIPARGGSKGLPGKNIRELAGLPLIAHTIVAAKTRSITQIIVSSDYQKILDVAKEYGSIPLLRPSELAQDITPTAPVIRHAMESISDKNDPTIILLQPTSPLRDSADIEAAIALFETSECDGLISVYKMEKTPFKAYVATKDGKLTGLVSDQAPYTPRQLLPDAFYPNGAIYIFKWSKFLEYNEIPCCNLIGYQMTEEKSIDIDSLSDLKQAEQILRGKNNDQYR